MHREIRPHIKQYIGFKASSAPALRLRYACIAGVPTMPGKTTVTRMPRLLRSVVQQNLALRIGVQRHKRSFSSSTTTASNW